MSNTNYENAYNGLVQTIEAQKAATEVNQEALKELKERFLEEVLIPLCNDYAVAWVQNHLYPLCFNRGTDLRKSQQALDPARFGWSKDLLCKLAGTRTVFPTKLSLSTRRLPYPANYYALDRLPFPPEVEASLQPRGAEGPQRH